jgi:hypothetical protein
MSGERKSGLNIVWVGYYVGKNDVAVIYVVALPVTNSHERVLPPAITVTLGIIWSPLKDVI